MAETGRPSKYPEDIEERIEAYKSACATVPSVAGLAVFLKVGRRTVYGWAEERPEFSHMLEELLAEQESRLLDGGLGGDYNATITKLMLAKHGYVEKQEVTGNNGGPIEVITSEMPADKAAEVYRDLLG